MSGSKEQENQSEYLDQGEPTVSGERGKRKKNFIDLYNLVVMGCHLQQPLVLNLNGVPHILFCCEHQFVVDDPARQVLEQGGVGMDLHGLVVLHSLVVARFGEPGSVVEVASSDGLPDRHCVNWIG